jgi:hypothetical protein
MESRIHYSLQWLPSASRRFMTHAITANIALIACRGGLHAQRGQIKANVEKVLSYAREFSYISLLVGSREHSLVDKTFDYPRPARTFEDGLFA